MKSIIYQQDGKDSVCQQLLLTQMNRSFCLGLGKLCFHLMDTKKKKKKNYTWKHLAKRGKKLPISPQCLWIFWREHKQKAEAKMPCPPWGSVGAGEVQPQRESSFFMMGFISRGKDFSHPWGAGGNRAIWSPQKAACRQASGCGFFLVPKSFARGRRTRKHRQLSLWAARIWRLEGLRDQLAEWFSFSL